MTDEDAKKLTYVGEPAGQGIIHCGVQKPYEECIVMRCGSTTVTIPSTLFEAMCGYVSIGQKGSHFLGSQRNMIKGLHALCAEASSRSILEINRRERDTDWRLLDETAEESIASNLTDQQRTELLLSKNQIVGGGIREHLDQIKKWITDEDRTMQYVATRLGVSRERIRQVCNEHGVQRIKGFRKGDRTQQWADARKRGAAICAMRKTGMSVDEIVLRSGSSRQTVYRHLRRAGMVKARLPKTLNKKHVPDIVRMIRKGKSAKEVAEKYGVNVASVWCFLNRRGVGTSKIRSGEV